VTAVGFGESCGPVVFGLVSVENAVAFSLVFGILGWVVIPKAGVV